MRVLKGAAPAAPLPTGTVTFLLADLEGSVRQWEGDRAGMTQAIARLDAVVDEAIGHFRGARPVEQGEGDSFVAAFGKAEDAVACALAIQQAMLDGSWPAGIELKPRMAVHTGDAQLRDEANYVGPAINRCGRLRALAHGGQTLVSATTYELVADALPHGAALHDLGLQQIRDVARPLRVYQLNHPSLPDGFPPLRSLEALARNLPPQLTRFIGRETELHDIKAALTDTRLLTLTGAGGCGKTRLALRVADDVAESFADGVWFADLSLVAEGEGILPALAAALGRRPEPGRPLADTVVDHLRPRRGLLVIDNCEHVVAVCAEVVDTVLRSCPAVVVIATSREPLRVEGEVAWRVPSMTAPGRDGDAASLTTYDAVRLFIDRATQARPNFTVTNANAPAVAAICQQLDGIPLAIELAAARVRMMSPDQIAAGLSDRFRLLRGAARTTLARQQTLAASVDWSHDLLSEQERALLRRLSVFVGGFTLDAAEHVGRGEGIDTLDVLDLLSALVDKSLVVAVADGPGCRYRLLETIRQYAAGRAEAAGEVDTIAAAHAEFFAHFAERAAPRLFSDDQVEWLEHVDAEHDNIRAALDWGIARGDGRTALRLVVSVGMFWNIRGHWHEAHRWAAKALAAAERHGMSTGPLVEWGRFLRAGFAAMLGDLAPALKEMQELTDIWRTHGDDFALGWGLNQLGKYVAVDDIPRARHLLDESAAAAARSGVAGLLADTLGTNAALALVAGEPDAASRLLETARRAAQDAGDQRGLLVAASPGARLALRTGDFAAARALADESAEIASAIGDGFSIAMAMLVSADVAIATGRYDEARELIEAGTRVGQNTGSAFVGTAEGHLARWALATGDAAAACDLYRAMAARLDPMQTWLFSIFVGAGSPAEAALDAATMEIGRIAEAGRAARAIADSSRAAGNRLGEANALLVLAEVNRRRGDTTGAERDAHAALSVFSAAAAPIDTARTLDVLAAVAADEGRWTESARLLGAATAMMSERGAVRWVLHQRHADDLLERIRAALAEEADVALSSGAGLAPAEVLAYATRGRGARPRAKTGWDSLTRAEADVVRAVASGATNREAGERLFMSPNTVKLHLSHAFAKLGVSGRAELAAAWARREAAAGDS